MTITQLSSSSSLTQELTLANASLPKLASLPVWRFSMTSPRAAMTRWHSAFFTSSGATRRSSAMLFITLGFWICVSSLPEENSTLPWAGGGRKHKNYNHIKSTFMVYTCIGKIWFWNKYSGKIGIITLIHSKILYCTWFTHNSPSAILQPQFSILHLLAPVWIQVFGKLVDKLCSLTCLQERLRSYYNIQYCTIFDIISLIWIYCAWV